MDKMAQLEWQISMGADEALEDASVNRLAPKVKAENAAVSVAVTPPAAKPVMQEDTQPFYGFAEPPAPAMSPLAMRSAPVAPQIIASPTEAMLKARQLADSARTLAELRDAVKNFDGLAICRTATNTVFADGNPEAQIMFIGEAPGANEDAEGIPFCGQAGQLMDTLVKWIGLDRRKNIYISNTLFWRPPGNRRPTPEELAVCKPFVEKHIALVNPKILVLWGATATTALLDSKIAITKLRGTFHHYTNGYLGQEIDTLAVFHPSYLLRQPGQKREMWRDLLVLQDFIREKGIVV